MSRLNIPVKSEVSVDSNSSENRFNEIQDVLAQIFINYIKNK